MKFYLVYTSILFVIFSCTSKSPNNNPEKNEPSEKRIVRKHFLKHDTYKLEYLNAWTIDSTDKDFVIENNFSIDSPDDASVLFLIFNTPTDIKDQIAEQVNAHLQKTMKGAKVKYFEQWGNYKGYGAIITGKFLGAFGGSIKVFAHTNDSSSFIVATQLFDTHTVNDTVGIALIESSFKLLK